MRWTFVNLALHPAVASMSTISPDSRERINRGVAKVLERLVTDTCRKEVIDAFPDGASEGVAMLLSQVLQEMMTNPSVHSGFKEYAKQLDQAKFETLLKALQDRRRP